MCVYVFMSELYINMSIVEKNDTKFMKNKMAKFEHALIFSPYAI